MTTEIKGREVMKVIALPGEHPYSADSKMKDKKYRRFAYLGKAFVANIEDAFCSAFDAKDLYSIDLETNADGLLSLVGHTTLAQELKMAKAETMLASFTVENVLSGKINFEELV